MEAARIAWKPKISLRIGVRALSKLSGRLLKGGHCYPAPLGEKAQMRITADCSLMANLAQKVAHTRMVFEIPGREVRWQPLNLERPRCRAHRKRPLQNGPEGSGIALRPHPQPVIEIALRPEVARRDERAPAGPERPRERDGPVGRVAVERNARACRMT